MPSELRPVRPSVAGPHRLDTFLPGGVRRRRVVISELAPDLDILVDRVGSVQAPDADRACAELARRAPVDRVAARALLQVLRPRASDPGPTPRPGRQLRRCRPRAAGHRLGADPHLPIGSAPSADRRQCPARRPQAVPARPRGRWRPGHSRRRSRPAMAARAVSRARGLEAEGPSMRRAHARLV